jgi:phosphotransferase system enzyme I (PtsP)
MLAKLQKIIQRVNAAANLHEAFGIIVHQVKAAMGTDACSVFVRDPAAPQYDGRAEQQCSR